MLPREAVSPSSSRGTYQYAVARPRVVDKVRVQKLWIDRTCLEQPVKEPIKPVRQIGALVRSSTSPVAAGACNRIRMQ